MSASKFLNRKIWPRLSYTQDVVVLSLLALFILALLSSSGFLEYKYFSAKKSEANCNKLFEDKDFQNAASECYKSVGYWYNQEVKDKAVKSVRLYTSHMDYLAGLEAFQNTEWEKAIELLTKVAIDDPDYSDTVEKIASAKKELALLDEKGKVAGAEDKKDDRNSKSTTNYFALQTAKTTKPPKISSSTQKKLSQLEEKVQNLSKPKTFSPPDNPTLSLTNSQISAIVDIWCLNKDFTDLLPYSGSGTIYNSEGYIYTNKHVVQQQDGTVPLTFCAVGVTSDISKPPDYIYIASLYAYSPSTDVADLTIYWDIDFNELPSNKTFPNIQIGSSASMKPGDPVWVAGYPDYGGYTWTLTEGIISGRVGNDLKTDAQISFGNSGGSALNKNKRLIGIPTWVSSGGGGSLGYIIAIDVVTSLTDWIYST